MSRHDIDAPFDAAHRQRERLRKELPEIAELNDRITKLISQKYPHRKRTSDAFILNTKYLSEKPHFKHYEKGWCCTHFGHAGRGTTVYQALTAFAEAVGRDIGFVEYWRML